MPFPGLLEVHYGVAQEFTASPSPRSCLDMKTVRSHLRPAESEPIFIRVPRRLHARYILRSTTLPYRSKNESYCLDFSTI